MIVKSAYQIRIVENHGMLQFRIKHWTWAIPSCSSASAHFHGLLWGLFYNFLPSRKMLGHGEKK